MAEERVPILKKQNSDSKSIYFAAALFASRECVFNIELANSLEEKGYKVNLPQRDGFEFGSYFFDKIKLDNKFLPTRAEKDFAFAWIIYMLDVGKFLFESDVLIANLDETLDVGVIIEMSFAR